MERVTFRCNGEYKNLFHLYLVAKLNSVPVIGDIIVPNYEHFIGANFRVKTKIKAGSETYNFINIRFKIISRQLSLKTNSWLLICEPLPKDIAKLLKDIKVN